ncbi:MAG: DUF4087 domain-containing protein [Microvirga sp.]
MTSAGAVAWIGVVGVAILVGPPAAAAENRCGWYLNPTPGNLLLIDRDGPWWITSQMQANGPDADGADDKAPNFDARQFVKTQPNGYGYGCACLTVETDRSANRVTKVVSGSIRPLSQCRADRSLPKPEM